MYYFESIMSRSLLYSEYIVFIVRDECVNICS